MPRRRKNREVSFGSDSFLDVIANLVGVLVILIVLVALRIVNAPPGEKLIAAEEALNEKLDTMTDELELIKQRRRFIEGSILELSRDQLDLSHEKDGLAEENDRAARGLSGLIEKIEQQMVANSADAEQLEALGVERERLVRELNGIVDQQRPRRKLVHRNPISRPADATELHFELMAGRIAFVDVDRLSSIAKRKIRGMERELRSSGTAVAHAGPIGGFRLSVTMKKDELSFSESLGYGRGGFRAVLDRWVIQPVDLGRGEPVSDALTSGSQLTELLGDRPASGHSITVWVYPDSFAPFRELRDYLADRGYSVAARPLPSGKLITGSTNGSRSMIQ